MRLLILSDLHFEIRNGQRWLDSIDWPDHDVAVIAGDISNYRLLERSIRQVCDKFKQVVYVPGNHDSYGATIGQSDDLLEVLNADIDNLRVLTSDTVNYIQGVPFVGDTLWFPESPDSVAMSQMNDFFQIGDIDKAYQKNKDFPRSLIDSDTIVVSHHLPSWRSVHPQYKGSSINKFFVSDEIETVIWNKPKLWVHGHTHRYIDYKIEDTRVVANPLGYLMEAGNWRPLVIDTDEL